MEINFRVEENVRQRGQIWQPEHKILDQGRTEMGDKKMKLDNVTRRNPNANEEKMDSNDKRK